MRARAGRPPKRPTRALSRGGAVLPGAPTQSRLLDGGRPVSDIQHADVLPGRGDLVDAVQDIVVQERVRPREHVFELLDRARPDDRGRDLRVRYDERGFSSR